METTQEEKTLEVFKEVMNLLKDLEYEDQKRIIDAVGVFYELDK